MPTASLPGESSREQALDDLHLARAMAAYDAREKDSWYEGELEGVLAPWVNGGEGASSPHSLPPLPQTGTVSLKMEPFVLHVQCRRVDAAKRLLSAAIGDSGYRNSGMIPPGKKIMVGIRTAAGLGLDVPLMLEGVNFLHPSSSPGSQEGNDDGLGGRAYLWALLHRANEKMKQNEKKIELLGGSIAKRLDTNAAE